MPVAIAADCLCEVWEVIEPHMPSDSLAQGTPNHNFEETQTNEKLEIELPSFAKTSIYFAHIVVILSTATKTP